MTTRVDRRIQRTQEALRQAFIELIVEKGFAATSIQDIATRANVNRGTFYIHFADKYALFNAVSRDRFRQELAARLPVAAQWNRQTLHLLIQAVLDNFEGKYHHQHLMPPFLAEITPMLERAVREELTGLLQTWLQHETTARIVGWAIFGSALQWSQEPISISSDQIARDILAVIVDGLSLPDLLLE